MKPETIALLASAAFAFAVFSAAANAAGAMTIEKSLEKSGLKAGDKAVILLDIKNPFSQPVMVRIADKNIFANNGIDIQCIEYSIPASSSARLSYEPIELFTGGSYALEPAKATYTNPETQKEETATSNSLDVKIAGSSAGSSNQQAITTIYRCNGQSMTSTAYTSSGGQQPQQQQEEQQQPQQTQKQPDPSQKMQNSQMPQDANAIKQAMQKQAEEEKKTRDEFSKQVSQNPEVQKMQKELSEKGFTQKSQSASAESNDTGDFQINYTKPNGETAKIAGRMENGEMKDAYSQNSEDDKNIMSMLQNNSEYQKYENALKKEGLSQMQPEIQKRNETYSVTVPFNAAANASANTGAVPANMTNVLANITAIVENNTVKDVNLQKNDTRKSQYLWLVPLLLAMAYFIYKKYLRKPQVLPQQKIIAAPKISYKQQAMAMLEEAKKMFSEGAQKEAYALVSEAVRFYFREKLALQKEVASSELVHHLRRAKIKHSNVQKCLNMCGLVEFAKYVPTKEDFDEIVGLAEREIV